MSGPSSILTMARTEEGVRAIEQRLEGIIRDMPWLSLEKAHPNQLLSRINPAKTAIVVISVPEWTAHEHALLLSARAQGFDGPVIIMVPTAIDPERKCELVRTWVIERPSEFQELHGLAKRALLSRGILPRAHERLATDEDAEVGFDVQGKVPSWQKAKVTNVSLGGAFLEMPRPVPVQKDELLQVTIKFPDSAEAKLVTARVAWVSRTRFRTGFGVEFVTS